ncbi:MAG TPA: hypothetical protein VGG20_15860 [Thermoanaerobaculia bacterium]|jgi:hypothetical protein
MKIQRPIASSLVVLCCVSGAAFAQDKHGTANVKLSTAQAYQENGSSAPSKDAACKAKYKTYMGAPVATTYTINPKTGIMTASSVFQNATTQLFPMGLSGSYSFMSDGVPPELQKLGVMRVIFQLSKQFTAPKSMIMFPLETGFNCVLTNGALKAEAAKEALNGKPVH